VCTVIFTQATPGLPAILPYEYRYEHNIKMKLTFISMGRSPVKELKALIDLSGQTTAYH